jgi:Fic family protein
MEVKTGEYKSRPNSVITATGETFHYASVEETPAFMTALVRWYNEEAGKKERSPIELAALLHYRYIRIHPFEDGNGRIARLLVNFVLHRYRYPMIVIHADDKPNYLRILHQCDVEAGLTPSDGSNASFEDVTPFVDYLKNLLIHALETAIKAAQGEKI